MSENVGLAEEIHKPVIKKFKRRKVYERFEDNIWSADLAKMGLISFYNHGVKYLLCVIDVFTKYTWIKPLKYKKAKTVLHGFIEIVTESKRNPNILWVDQGKEFYNSLKQNNDNEVLTHLTHNEGRSVIAERFIKTLEGKIFKNHS